MRNWKVLNNLKTWSLKCPIQKICSTSIFELAKMNHNVRWAFNVAAWEPTRDQILAASGYIQLEEKQRISRFVFQNDAKPSLIGRLMLRKYAHFATSTPYCSLVFGRDDRGKPYLKNPANSTISFNISHQGDYVVLAGHSTKNVGVDVMKIETPVNKNIPEFFRLMQRQFSQSEWATIRSYSTQKEQVACFYRIWCLKESYVKNLGVGISIPLNEISFCIKTLEMKVGDKVRDTILMEKREVKEGWVFEETLLDETHVAAVAINVDASELTQDPFTFISYEELVEDAVQISEPDSVFTDNFINKKNK